MMWSSSSAPGGWVARRCWPSSCPDGPSSAGWPPTWRARSSAPGSRSGPGPRGSATRAMIEREAPDAVIVATGARSWCPEIAGADEAHVVDAWQVLRDEVNVGASVVVADATLEWTGMGIAEKLIRTGSSVRLCVMGDMAGQTLPSSVRNHWAGVLHGLGVEVRPLLRLAQCADDAVGFIHTCSGEPVIEENVDTLVVVQGRIQESALEDALADYDGDVRAISAIASRRAPPRRRCWRVSGPATASWPAGASPAWVPRRWPRHLPSFHRHDCWPGRTPEKSIATASSTTPRSSPSTASPGAARRPRNARSSAAPSAAGGEPARPARRTAGNRRRRSHGWSPPLGPAGAGRGPARLSPRRWARQSPGSQRPMARSQTSRPAVLKRTVRGSRSGCSGQWIAPATCPASTVSPSAQAGV